MELPSIQGILDNVIANIIVWLLAAVGAYVLTRWARKFYDLAPPIRIILGIVVYGFIMLAVNQTVDLFRSKTQVITTEMSNEELSDTIRKWLDDFHLQVQAKEHEEAYFGFVVRNAGNIPVEVMRLRKEREESITLIGLVTIVESDQVKLKAFSEQQRELVYREIALELSRQRMGSISMNASQVIIETRVPLTELTQAKLIDRINDVTYAINLVVLKVRILLDSIRENNRM